MDFDTLCDTSPPDDQGLDTIDLALEGPPGAASYLLSGVRIRRSEMATGLSVAVVIHLLVLFAFSISAKLLPPPTPEYRVLTVSLVGLLQAPSEEGGGGQGMEGCAEDSGTPQESVQPEAAPPPPVEPSVSFEPAPAPVEAPPKPVEKPRKAVQVRETPRRKAAVAPAAIDPQAEKDRTGSPEHSAPSASAGPGDGGPVTEGSGTPGASSGGDRAGGAGGSPSGEFQLPQVDKPPVVVRKVDPEYPFAARRKNLCGKVTVKFLVTSSGEVSKANVIDASPPGVFESSALEAVRLWRFKPGMYQGRAVATWIVIPIQFKVL